MLFPVLAHNLVYDPPLLEVVHFIVNRRHHKSTLQVILEFRKCAEMTGNLMLYLRRLGVAKLCGNGWRFVFSPCRDLLAIHPELVQPTCHRWTKKVLFIFQSRVYLRPIFDVLCVDDSPFRTPCSG